MLGARGLIWREQKLPHADITALTFDELWGQPDSVFYIKINVTGAMLTFFSRKQAEGESLERFHATLTAPPAKFQLHDLEQELVRDLFITNFNDLEVHRRFLQRAMDAAEVHHIARNITADKQLNSPWGSHARQRQSSQQ